uniref:Zn(2)-C6 fungal-type domain-containing protein n=1 Tax=Mycena chlorophos TaxID=658473 RepID=A0ABQ0LGL7_MYCCL|nr:predicted protein [Mycena chlorophos]
MLRADSDGLRKGRDEDPRVELWLGHIEPLFCKGYTRERLDLLYEEVLTGGGWPLPSPSTAYSNSMDEISDDAGLVSSTTGPGAPDTSWTSRRGKARCDACRLKNLKCDRVLPVCNQCKWGASGTSIPCKYTPLPTPAHRGVPRCDRCRESNLKCDRAAPVCQYCRDANITDCRYTPKKRARLPMEPQSPGSRPPYAEGESASFMFTNGPSAGPSTNSYTRSFVPESDKPDRMDIDGLPLPLPKPTYEPGPPLALLPAPSPSGPPPPPSAYPAPPAQAFIAHSFPTPTRSHTFAAWTHAAFAPLPATLLRRLTNVTTAEMPARDAFDSALRQFRAGLEPSLRETAFLLAEDYAIVANCLAKGNTARLSPRLREWTQCHRLASGSDKFNLIVTPRDATFALPIEKAHELLKEYRVALDEEAERSKGRSSRRHTQNVGDPDSLSEPAFERIPVVNQIYDCLTYAHRGHASSVVVMMEIRRLGIATITWPMAEIFINLCPLCSKLKVGQSLGLNNFPATVSVPVVDAGHGAGTSISQGAFCVLSSTFFGLPLFNVGGNVGLIQSECQCIFLGTPQQQAPWPDMVCAARRSAFRLDAPGRCGRGTANTCCGGARPALWTQIIIGGEWILSRRARRPWTRIYRLPSWNPLRTRIALKLRTGGEAIEIRGASDTVEREDATNGGQVYATVDALKAVNGGVVSLCARLCGDVGWHGNRPRGRKLNVSDGIWGSYLNSARELRPTCTMIGISCTDTGLLGT